MYLCNCCILSYEWASILWSSSSPYIMNNLHYRAMKQNLDLIFSDSSTNIFHSKTLFVLSNALCDLIDKVFPSFSLFAFFSSKLFSSYNKYTTSTENWHSPSYNRSFQGERFTVKNTSIQICTSSSTLSYSIPILLKIYNNLLLLPSRHSRQVLLQFLLSLQKQIFLD